MDIYGNVWTYVNKKKPYKLVLMINKFGYCVVNLYIKHKPKQFRVNRLVAEAFIPNPDNLPQVNHKDGDKLNNNVENLEWCTAKYNTDHAIATGLRINSGETFHSSKLKEKDVHKICKLLESNKYTAKQIPSKIGKHCTLKMVHNIMYNGCWKEISSQYDLSKHTIEGTDKVMKLKEKDVHKICKLLQNTSKSYREIAEEVGCDIYDVNHIKNGHIWKRVSQYYDFSHRNK